MSKPETQPGATLTFRAVPAVSDRLQYRPPLPPPTGPSKILTRATAKEEVKEEMKEKAKSDAAGVVAELLKRRRESRRSATASQEAPSPVREPTATASFATRPALEEPPPPENFPLQFSDDSLIPPENDEPTRGRFFFPDLPPRDEALYVAAVAEPAVEELPEDEESDPYMAEPKEPSYDQQQPEPQAERQGETERMNEPASQEVEQAAEPADNFNENRPPISAIPEEESINNRMLLSQEPSNGGGYSRKNVFDRLTADVRRKQSANKRDGVLSANSRQQQSQQRSSRSPGSKRRVEDRLMMYKKERENRLALARAEKLNREMLELQSSPHISPMSEKLARAYAEAIGDVDDFDAGRRKSRTEVENVAAGFTARQVTILWGINISVDGARADRGGCKDAIAASPRAQTEEILQDRPSSPTHGTVSDK